MDTNVGILINRHIEEGRQCNFFSKNKLNFKNIFLKKKTILFAKKSHRPWLSESEAAPKGVRA